ncbi:MAG: hypothetical protein GKR94_00730 [Gammaproteobacteria bacterium]|nr:hypothetical protein [Gammaproteobacteria bacterium]
MNVAAVRAELEQELTWRIDEMRFLKNRIADISSNSQKMRYRKSLVVMLYAHYEGFFKFALLLYVRCINNEKIKCGEATSAIVAGSWHELFNAVESGDRKEKVFNNQLPAGDFLHRFARRREFVEQLSEFQQTLVNILESTIDTESNLWPEVLQKNLYRIGLKHDAFNRNDGTIYQLVNRRNDVAHGSQRDGVKAQEYNRMEHTVFKMMDDFMLLIVCALRGTVFRKPASIAGTP